MVNLGALGGGLGGIAGHGLGAAGGAMGGIFSAMDAPGRAVRGVLTSAMGGQPGATDMDGDEAQPRNGSILPAAVGLAGGLAASFIPGLTPLAPYVGAASAGLAQMIGEAIDPIGFSSFTPSEITQRMGIGGNPLVDFAAGAAMDPLTYAGAIGGANPEALAGAGGGLMKRMGRMLPETPPVPMSAAAAENVGNRLLKYQAADSLPGMSPLGLGPMPPPSALPAGPLPGGIQAMQDASMAGYNPAMQAAMPGLDAYANGATRQYQNVNPAVAGPMRSLGWMDDAGSAATGGRRLAGGLPDFAQVRGGRVMPTPGMQVPDTPDMMSLMQQKPPGMSLGQMLGTPLDAGQFGPQQRADMLARLRAMNAGG